MRKLLSEEIAESISTLIHDKYPPRSKIPTESELAELFAVSRTTIREAIKHLRSQGILEVRRGSGTFVCDTPGLVSDPLGMKFMERGKLITEMGEFSFVCQPGFAALAALRATDEDIAALEENYRLISSEWAHFQQNQNLSEQERNDIFIRIRQLDVEFHTILRVACHNSVISRIDSIFLEFSSLDPIFIHAIETSIYWHPIIIDAVRNRDPDSCERAMRQHIIDINNHVASGETFNPQKEWLSRQRTIR